MTSLQCIRKPTPSKYERNFPPLVYVDNAKISVYIETPHLFNIFSLRVWYLHSPKKETPRLFNLNFNKIGGTFFLASEVHFIENGSSLLWAFILLLLSNRVHLLSCTPSGNFKKAMSFFFWRVYPLAHAKPKLLLRYCSSQGTGGSLQNLTPTQIAVLYMG